jgi:hypothetical protein
MLSCSPVSPCLRPHCSIMRMFCMFGWRMSPVWRLEIIIHDCRIHSLHFIVLGGHTAHKTVHRLITI